MVGLLCRLTRLRRRRSLIDAAPAEAQRRSSRVNVSRTCAPSEPALGRSAPSGDHRARSVQHGPSFSTVRVAPDFSPGDYADTFAALQSPTSSKVLDLVPARLLCADIFERLSGVWTATSDAVPRLGIVLSFERWVMLRDVALAALQPLIERGIRVQVFYAEQASAGYLAEWFARCWVVHDVRAAIGTLARRWHPSPNWPMVVDALARLARAYASASELPTLLTEIAALALSCGGAVEAETLACEALYYLPESPSATRGQALRELGTALICQGRSAAGLAFLDQAVTMTEQAHAPDVGASALCHSGLYALSHGDYLGAERRFRRAIDLLSPPIRRPHLLALAHHSLAVALMHQGRPDAEQHARAALALRRDPDSRPAREDRILLAKLRALRGDAVVLEECCPGVDRVPISSLPARPRELPEADVADE